MEAMDLMDPKRRMQHNVRLMVGYVLVGIALLLVTVILLFVAYGFGLQNGRVIQNGLLFLSSTPNPAEVYVDGTRYQNDTNTKLLLPEATYQITLKRAGYRDWQRPIAVTGGAVESYTYPLLLPADLTTKTVDTYISAPALASESADQHWLLVAKSPSLSSFDLYDLTNPGQAPTSVVLPVGVLTASSGKQVLTAVAWASDNNHLLLKHAYGAATEYILLNRSSPSDSQNLTKSLHLPTTAISMQFDGGQNDHYLVFDSSARVVSRINLGAPTLVPILDHVLAFAADDSDGNSIAYVTPDSTSAEAGQVSVMLYDGSKKYVVRHDKPSDHYLLAVTTFDGDTYVAASSPLENTAYVYKDPIDQINNPRLGVAVPAQAFIIKKPNYVSFSPDSQYAVFENGKQFVAYDAANQQGFRYATTDGVDSAMAHASWLDTAQLDYVSHGQVVVFDYDGRNRQVLEAADARYPLAADNNYKFLYTFTQSSSGSSELLTSTTLRTPADQ